MAARLSVVIPAWGSYLELLPALIRALEREGDVEVIIATQGRAPASCPDAAVAALGASVGETRNAGLGRVRTPLVAFVDADDLPYPGGLAQLAAALEARPDAVLACGRSVQRVGGPYYAWPSARSFRPRARWLQLVRQFAWNEISTPGAVMRTKALRDAGGWPDYDLAEDGILACRMLAAGDVVRLDRPVRIYGFNPQGLYQRGRLRRDWLAAYAFQRDLLWADRRIGLRLRLLARALAPVHWLLALKLGYRGRRNRRRSAMSLNRGRPDPNDPLTDPRGAIHDR